jgi:hypothetical protein
VSVPAFQGYHSLGDHRGASLTVPLSRLWNLAGMGGVDDIVQSIRFE